MSIKNRLQLLEPIIGDFPKNSEVERLCACNKKAKDLLGWEPSVQGKKGLEDGLNKVTTIAAIVFLLTAGIFGVFY